MWQQLHQDRRLEEQGEEGGREGVAAGPSSQSSGDGAVLVSWLPGGCRVSYQLLRPKAGEALAAGSPTGTNANLVLIT